MRDSAGATPRPGVANWLSGGGEMGERIRAFDWANSPLGPVETWPQSLKTAVRIMLTSRQPIWLGWGEQLIKLYNDSYIMDVIERNGRSQIQLIEDLLDTARIISGKLKLDVRRFDLRAVVNAAIDSMLPAAASKNIRLDFVCHGEASAYEISGDADRLQQVVWNLLSNAVKFTNQGGRVQVALRRESSSVRIVVSDTGNGISADFLPFVFDRFRQGDSSASRRFGGLGLGLSLVKQLTELHGGDVHVDSPGEGEGATFTVNLPMRPEPRNEAAQNNTQHVRILHSRPAGYRLDGLNILVVDDDETARDLLSLTLQDHGAITASALPHPVPWKRFRRPFTRSMVGSRLMC